MVITRFAPSPTGDLHIGSARTAIFSWLWAKHQQGQFILRIEDTDRERSTQAAIQVILDGMEWLGLDYSGDAQGAPFYQSKRFDRYKAVAEQLLAQGKAYKCFCSKARLEALREQQIANKEKAKYDGHCRDRQTGDQDPEASYVIRFKTPQTGEVRFTDNVRGEIIFQNAELDDLIIVRSDGVPTYNFTVVVDDWEMGVTHVLRGDDHINNTPRQIHILQALGAQIPEYGHMPMILGPDGKKLSKRTGAVSVLQYREEGILPEALLNYLVRLGWSHGDQEIFSREELIGLFNIHDINASASAMNPEKLLWLNQHYLKTLPEAHIAQALQPHLIKLGADLSMGPTLTEIVLVQRERCKTLLEMAQKSLFFFQAPTILDESLRQKHFTPEVLPILQRLSENFAALEQWESEAVHDVLIQVASAQGMKLGLLAQPLRIALTGTTISPPMDVTLKLLGKQTTLRRLAQALEAGNREK